MNWINTGKGYFANPGLSRNYRRALAAENGFLGLVREEPGGGKHTGETLDFLKTYGINRPAGASLSIAENEPIPEYGMDPNKGTITLREYGAAVPISEFFDTLSTFSPFDATSATLKDDMDFVLNNLIASAAASTLVKYIPRSGPAYVLTTDGTLPSGTPAARSIQAWDLLQLRAIAVDRFKMKPIVGAPYQFEYVTTQTGIAALLNDADIKNNVSSINYGSAEKNPLVSGQLHIWNGIGLKVDNAYLSTTLGTTTYNSEGIFRGNDVVAGSTPVKPELRRKSGPTAGDYGRDMGVAWYAIMGFALTRGGDYLDILKNQAAAIHVTSY